MLLLSPSSCGGVGVRVGVRVGVCVGVRVGVHVGVGVLDELVGSKLQVTLYP